MLCDKCHSNEASVRITKIVNGVKEELNLCEKCAKGIDGIGIAGDIDFDENFSLQNLISGIMDYMNYSQPQKKTYESELICKNCGTSYSEFKESGLLGCSECYENFRSTLLPVIKRVQRNIEHSGKIPKKASKGIYNKRMINKLKEDLQKAIALENYENAAEIRDKIKELKQSEDI